MRIGLAAHQLNGKPQGIRSYLLYLLRHVVPFLGPGEEIVAYSYDPMASERLLGNVDGVRHARVFPRGPQLRIPLVMPALEVRDRLSVLHSQYVCPLWSPAVEVVSIHDILFETHPDLFVGSLSLGAAQAIRWSSRRARFVLTGSEFSRTMLLDHYGLPESKVVVIPNGVDPARVHPIEDAARNDAVRERYGLDGPFVLSVGRLEPRKNLARLVRAFDEVYRRCDAGIRLVLAGAPDFGYERIHEEAAKLPEGAVKLLGPVPDDDLPPLYTMASAFAYPSLAEGFGIPVLEAMACGAPVVTSRRGALHEVSGDAAFYVEPEDEDAIAAGLLRVLQDSEEAAELRRKGLARASQFRWDETARRTVEVYRRCAADRR